MAFALAGVFVLPACKPSGGRVSDPVIAVAEDDAKMDAAVHEARRTIDQFISALQNHSVGQSDFSVKMAFVDGKEVEHMWLTGIAFDNGHFHGKVGNEPQTVTTVAYGQEASVAADQVSDWLFLEHGRLVGGVSLRVLRDRMSPQERADFDRNVSFRFD